MSSRGSRNGHSRLARVPKSLDYLHRWLSADPATALVSAGFYGVKSGSDSSSDAQHYERASFLLTDVDEFGVNHIVLAAGLFAVISAVRRRRLGAGLPGSGLVHGLG